MSFESRLRDELPNLVKGKIITKQQADRIAKRYPVKDHESRLVGIVATFGAVLIALGILTLVAMNWQDISRVVRVLILLVATFGAAGAGYWMRFEKGFPRVGSSLLFLGAALVGVTLVLIAQMYHLALASGWWLLVWLAAIAPVAYFLRSKSTLILSLLVLSVWVAYRVSRFGHGWWSELEGMFQIWPLTVSIYLSYGALLWIAAYLHERSDATRDFAGVYRVLGAFFLFAATYFLTFKWFTDWFWRASEFAALGSAPIIAVWTVALLALAGIVYGAITQTDRATRYALGLIGILVLGAALIVTNPAFRPEGYYYNPDLPLFTPYSLVTNVVLLGTLIGSVAMGVAKRWPFLINLATLWFAIDVFTRYFEFFSDRLSGGTFFIVTGLILLLGAIALEKTRRVLLRSAGGA